MTRLPDCTLVFPRFVNRFSARFPGVCRAFSAAFRGSDHRALVPLQGRGEEPARNKVQVSAKRSIDGQEKREYHEHVCSLFQ